MGSTVTGALYPLLRTDVHNHVSPEFQNISK